MGKISAVKRKNIKGGKMSKGKKTGNKTVKKARRRLVLMKKLKQKNEAAAKGSKAKLDDIGAGDVLDMLDKDELAFMKSKDRIRNPESIVRAPKGKKRKRTEDDENDLLEELYETKTAKRMESEKKIRPLLPIKTGRGLEMQFAEEQIQIPSKAEKLSADTILQRGVSSKNGTVESIKPGQKITAAELKLRRKQTLTEYKIKIGSLCASFLEDPENRMKNLDSLLAMLVNPESGVTLSVPKICAISLQAVFQDVLPSYSIKHSHLDGVKLKAQTRELQGYETALLSRYKTYLQRLEKIVSKYLPQYRRGSNSVSEAERGFGLIALRCMGGMLCSHPYFNLASNIMGYIVPFLSYWDHEVRNIVSLTIQDVFSIDKRGEISMQIVEKINTLVKAKCDPKKSCVLRPDVLHVLLALRIKEADLLKEKKEEMIPSSKMTFEQRKMLSKKNRKKAKEMVQLEKELLEASAEENKVRKSRFLTQMINVVFTIYFRILKHDEVTESLLSAVLEGLSKFAHVINIDYFDDLLKQIGKIERRDDFSKQQALYCIRTVLTVLDGHGSVLALDPTSYHKALYKHLISFDSETDDETVSLALECVNLINKKKMPGPRAAAFVKRLTTFSLQLGLPLALECLDEVKRLIRMQNSARSLLDSEGSIASGVYLPEVEDPDHCMAQTSSLWELTILSRHYDPQIREAVRAMLSGYGNAASGLKTNQKHK